MSYLYYLVEHHFANSIYTGTISKEQAFKIVDETIDYFYNGFIDSNKNYNFSEDYIENSRINFGKLETAINVLDNFRELNNKLKDANFIPEQYYIINTLYDEEYEYDFNRVSYYHDKLNKDIIGSLDFSENYKDVLEKCPYVMNYLVLNYTDCGSKDHTKVSETEYNEYVDLVMETLDYFYNIFLSNDYTLDKLDLSEDNNNVKEDIEKYKSTLDNVEELNKKFLKLDINSDKRYLIINLFKCRFGYNFRNIKKISEHFYYDIIDSDEFYDNLEYYCEEYSFIKNDMMGCPLLLEICEDQKVTLSSIKYILNNFNVSSGIYNEVIISLYKLEDQNKAREIREYIKKWFRGY